MTKVFIIAEAGVNHNGSLEQAIALVDVAFNAGADAVKFQTFKADTLVCKDTELADYQKKSKENSQSTMLKRLELSEKAHQTLFHYCMDKKIEFMSTPFDIDSVLFLKTLGIKRFKIPSGEITNFPYLKEIAVQQLPVILSTGLSTLDEIGAALTVLINNGLAKENITLLHVTTAYPTPFDEVNLQAMVKMKEHFNIKVGYSDHTLGITVPIMAATLGAFVIEKHFTLDNKLEGPDHSFSLMPEALKAMVSAIREVALALGDGEKKVTQSEKGNSAAVRKSIVAKCAIAKGEIFSEENLTTKRPGNGLSPMLWEKIIGQVATRSYEEDERIAFGQGE